MHTKDAFTVKQSLSLLNDGRLSSVELTDIFLARIAAHESTIHAFITTTPETARQMAKEADQKRVQLKRTDIAIPPLLGLPIEIKDVI